MAKFDLRLSTKHLQIDKANSLMLIATAATTVVVVFSLVAANSLWKQMTYQNKVIGLKSDANQQLEKNIQEAENLKTAYDAFENSTESVIGTADKNSKVILDALPSKYDFPALATSLEGIINGAGTKIVNITGVDNEVQAEQNSISPKPIEIPVDITAAGPYTNIQKLIDDMRRSIRPFKIATLSLTGNDGALNAKITAITYYQPEKRLDIEQKVVPGPKTANNSSSTEKNSSSSTSNTSGETN
jgi:Pilus assembly protein, PilO